MSATIQPDTLCECGHTGYIHRRWVIGEGRHAKTVHECVAGAAWPELVCPCKDFRAVKPAQGESTMTTKGKKAKKVKRTIPARPKKEKKAGPSPAEMAGLVDKRTVIYAAFKDHEIEAVLTTGGQIETDESHRFNSFSAAAKHVTGGASINGWTFWKYRDGENLVAVDTLRKKKDAA